MARYKKAKLVIVVDCHYDPERFAATVANPGPDKANLIDVACFAEKLTECQ